MTFSFVIRISQLERAASPEDTRMPNNHSRAKLRRSRSACDIHDMRPMKRMESTLAPIPAKSSRLMMSSTLNNALTTNRPPRIAGNSNALTATTSLTATKRVVPQNVKPVAGRAPPNATAKKLSSSSSTSAATTGAGKPINKRIPPYDFKARYNDLLEKHKVLKEKYEQKCEQMGNLENLPEQLEETQSQLITTQDELKNSQTMNECLQRQSKMQQETIESVEASLSKTTDELEQLKKEFNVSTIKKLIITIFY